VAHGARAAARRGCDPVLGDGMPSEAPELAQACRVDRSDGEVGCAQSGERGARPLVSAPRPQNELQEIDFLFEPLNALCAREGPPPERLQGASGRLVVILHKITPTTG